MQRCKAKSKRSGDQCKNFAIKGWNVCRMHGAHGGPKIAQGRNICKKAATKHGFYKQETLEKLREIHKLLRINKNHIRSFDDKA